MAVSMYMGKPLHGTKPDIAIDLFDSSLEHIAPSYLTSKLNEKIMGGLIEKSGTTTYTNEGNTVTTVYDDGMKDITNITEDGNHIERTIYSKSGVALMTVTMVTDPVTGNIRKDVKYDGSVNGVIPFKDATFEEIRIMLMRHYAGVIDLSNYWSVGDTKVIECGSTTDIDNSDITGANHTITILGFNKDLISNGGTAAVTIGFKNGISTGVMHKSKSVSGWKNTDRRTWFNETFFDSLPDGLKPLVKSVKKYTKVADNGVETIDKCFLLSETEIKSSPSFGYTGEGEQYDYFKTNNAIKYPTDSSNIASRWYTRSVSKDNNAKFVTIDADGKTSIAVDPDSNYLIIPTFCI